MRYYIKDRNVLCEVKMNIAQSKCNKYVFAFSSLLLTYFICINVIPTVQGCFVTSLVKINTVVLEKTILKMLPIHFRDIAICLILKKLYSLYLRVLRANLIEFGENDEHI